MGIFAGFNAVPEDASLYQGQAFANNDCLSMELSITGDASAMTSAGAGSYRVLGSNKSALVADMVPIADDLGSNAARLLTVPYSRANWPFKYIGIQYTTSTGTGTVSIYWNQAPHRVKV